MEDIAVRFATPEDAAAIGTIYNQGIEDRVATLETDLRSADERRQWMAARGSRHPVIVAEQAGSVRGKGVGRRLLERLIALARQLGYHKMVLAAFPLNTAGMALYERLGFTTVGVYREQGRLDGAWVDVVIMEKLL